MRKGVGPVDDARAVVVGRLRARRLETDEAIFERVRDLAPGASGLADPEYIAGLRAAVAAALEYVLVGIERGETDGSPPTPPVPAVALEQARRAARFGVSLDTVLRRYLAGLAILEGFVVQEAMDGIPPTRLAGDGLRDVLATMSALVDRLITAVSHAYGEEIEPAPHAAPRRRASPGRVVGPRRDPPSRRDSVLDAVVDVVAEHGVAGASVGLVIARARISRRTFYECFAGLDECLIAVLDGALERAAPLVAQAFAGKGAWQDGMRLALAAMLAFFDEEPALARVCLVEMPAAAPVVRERRAAILQVFSAQVMARIESEVSHPSPLAAEGAYVSVVGIVGARLIAREPEPLIGLLGPLMGTIVGPFMDAAEVQREIELGEELSRKIKAERARLPAPGTDEPEPSEVEIPAMLRNPRAQRARMCVRYLAAQGREGIGPSNREIAAGIGIANEGQISKLLVRLERGAVVSKFSHGVGRPNAWRLTPYGEEIAAHFERRENS